MAIENRIAAGGESKQVWLSRVEREMISRYLNQGFEDRNCERREECKKVGGRE